MQSMSRDTINFDSVIFHFQSGAFPAETDPNEGNNEDTLTTLLAIFGDGFESGNTSAWSVTQP